MLVSFIQINIEKYGYVGIILFFKYFLNLYHSSKNYTKLSFKKKSYFYFTSIRNINHQGKRNMR